jgi:hypothetical protein
MQIALARGCLASLFERGEVLATSAAAVAGTASHRPAILIGEDATGRAEWIAVGLVCCAVHLKAFLKSRAGSQSLLVMEISACRAAHPNGKVNNAQPVKAASLTTGNLIKPSGCCLCIRLPPRTDRPVCLHLTIHPITACVALKAKQMRAMETSFLQ